MDLHMCICIYGYMCVDMIYIYIYIYTYLLISIYIYMSTRESMCTPPLQEGLPTAEPMHMSPTCAGGIVHIYIWI